VGRCIRRKGVLVNWKVISLISDASHACCCCCCCLTYFSLELWICFEVFFIQIELINLMIKIKSSSDQSTLFCASSFPFLHRSWLISPKRVSECVCVGVCSVEVFKQMRCICDQQFISCYYYTQFFTPFLLNFMKYGKSCRKSFSRSLSVCMCVCVWVFESIAITMIWLLINSSIDTVISISYYFLPFMSSREKKNAIETNQWWWFLNWLYLYICIRKGLSSTW